MLIDFVGLFEFGLKDFAHDDLIAQSALARSQDASWCRSGRSRYGLLGYWLLGLAGRLLGGANTLILSGKCVNRSVRYIVLRAVNYRLLLLLFTLLGSLGCVGYQAYHNNNYC